MQKAAPAVNSMLRALSDDTRLATVELLARAPYRAGQLALELGVTPPTMSKHLRVLLDAGIVVDQRHPDDSRVRIFRMRQQSFIAIQAWLDQIQAQWDEQLGAFKRHVESKESQ